MWPDIEKQLAGVWVPTFNWVRPDVLWPRLVFVDGRGFYEDGDYPAVYSVDHFDYRLSVPTVLEITASKQEFINDNFDGTEFDESWMQIRSYDLNFRLLNQLTFLEIEICPGPHRLAQYFKTDEITSAGYQPKWNLA